MDPNNTPPQPIGPTPNPTVIDGENIPPAPVIQVPQQPLPTVKPNNTNYAAAVFFVLLIIGFTFHLPTILYGPVVFFCIVAGILFFKDLMTTKKVPVSIPNQSGEYYIAEKRSPLKTILLVLLAGIGFCVLGFIGLIVFFVIMLGASGV